MSYQSGLNMLVGAITGGAFALNKGFNAKPKAPTSKPSKGTNEYTPTFTTNTPEEISAYAAYIGNNAIKAKRNVRYNKQNRMRKRGVI